MNIILSPQLIDGQLTIVKAGSVLTINGVDTDTATFNEEESNGYLIRVRGDDVTVLFPTGAEATEGQRFPDALINVPDGPVTLP